jgi:dipeptidyl-peptidase-4
MTGKLEKVLLPNSLGYRHLVSPDYYLASPDSKALGLYELSSGKRLTAAASQNSVVFSKDPSIYVLTSGSSTQMPYTTVHKADGTFIGELPSVAESPGFVPDVQFEDSAAIVRPKDFVAQKRYPVLVDVYGGPGHNHVVMNMRNWLVDQWLANQGFIVVAIENRGTPGRGHAWERAIYKNFGLTLEDQVLGLQALGKKFPELDLNRVGIFGWSFGGYLSALAVLKRPDIFKAAVAGAPVTDWEDYDTHYTERYLGMPKDNPQAYQEASLLTYADKLERPLLLVHGTNDDNVYFRHSLKLADALIRSGKKFELLPLVGQTHMLSDPVLIQQFWMRLLQFFQENLLSK